MAMDISTDYSTYIPPSYQQSSPPPESQSNSEEAQSPPEVTDISSDMGIGNNIDVSA